VGKLFERYSKAKYNSTAIDTALKDAFGHEDFLFGGPRSTKMSSAPVKVAVVAMSSDRSPVVFSNYNRPSPDTGMINQN
jgi:hypothetical protein